MTLSTIGDVDLEAWTYRSSQWSLLLEQFPHANIISICDCDINVVQRIRIDDKAKLPFAWISRRDFQTPLINLVLSLKACIT